jgi:hypothetical protein
MSIAHEDELLWSMEYGVLRDCSNYSLYADWGSIEVLRCGRLSIQAVILTSVSCRPSCFFLALVYSAT